MIKKHLLILSCTLSLTGCASIISKSDYPVSFTSEPDKANFKIFNKEEKIIHEGITPQIVTLQASRGYFKKEEYTIEFNKDGYQTTTSTITPKVDGWYISNIFSGGMIGLLFIDPTTGAMYKIEPEHNIELEK